MCIHCHFHCISIAPSYDEIVNILISHLSPKPLVIAERFRFHKRDQTEGERCVSVYQAEFCKLAEHWTSESISMRLYVIDSSADCEMVTSRNGYWLKISYKISKPWCCWITTTNETKQRSTCQRSLLYFLHLATDVEKKVTLLTTVDLKMQHVTPVENMVT